MAEEKKRLYWLSLKKDFFKRHDVRIIKGMENGKDYIIFYLELLCESLDHQGKLRFSEAIPYNESMLATITDTNIDIVRSAIKLFIQLGLVEIWDDGTYFMTRVQEMSGSYVDNDNARRQREFYERQKLKALEERYDGVRNPNDNQETISNNHNKNDDISPLPPLPEENDGVEEAKETAAYQGITAHDVASEYQTRFNNIPGVIKFEKMTVKREMAISTILSHYSQAEIDKVFDKVAKSDFLTGINNINFKATFDWLFNMDNFAKVLEGNYDNRKDTSKKSGEMDREWSEHDEELKRREEEFMADWEDNGELI